MTFSFSLHFSRLSRCHLRCLSQSGAVVSLLLAVGCRTASTQVGEEVPEPWREARVSLQVRNEPLPRLLALFGQMTGAHFRFGSPLDAEVSPSLRDAPFWPAMSNLLHTAGFRAQIATPPNLEKTNLNSLRLNSPRSGIAGKALPDIWVFRREEKPTRIANDSGHLFSPRRDVAQAAQFAPGTAAFASSATWQQWMKMTAPPIGWMSPASPGQSAAGASMSWNGDAGVAMRESGWKTMVPVIEVARRPGIGIVAQQIGLLSKPPFATDAAVQTGVAGASQVVRLRWPLWLREAPQGAQLLLQTSARATVWINGARLLRDWSGTRLIDVGDVLRPGANCIAMEWLQPPKSRLAPVRNADKTPPEPLLRYEWLFASL